MKQLYGYIYLITNDINDKKYVGQTRETVRSRFNRHCRDTKHGPDTIDEFIQTHGVSHFHVTTLEKVPLEILNQRERYWIQVYDSYYNGYNKTLGGQGDPQYTEEDISSAIDAYLEGMPVIEIEANYMTRSTLYKYLKAAGIPPRGMTEQAIQSSIENAKKATLVNQIPIYNITLDIIYDSKKDALIDMIQKGYSKAKDWHNIRTALDKALAKTQKTAFGFEWRYVNG